MFALLEFILNILPSFRRKGQVDLEEESANMQLQTPSISFNQFLERLKNIIADRKTFNLRFGYHFFGYLREKILESSMGE